MKTERIKILKRLSSNFTWQITLARSRKVVPILDKKNKYPQDTVPIALPIKVNNNSIKYLGLL